jgi:LacI family transcriptional regulator
MPCVFLGSNHDGACSFVTVDNELGAYEGVRYLNCLGNRRIVYLGGRSDSMTSKERTAGFWRAVQELGLDGQEYPCPPEFSDNDRTDQLIRQFFRESDLPDAIFAYSDRFAFSVMQEAEARHIRIPEDVSLLGFDNVYFSSLPRIQLTTISHHKKELGRLTAARMLARLAGDTEEFHDVLRPELIIRSTCGKPRSRRK